MGLVIKQLSVMDQNEKYQYKFQYSLANYHPNFSEVSQEEKDFFSQDEVTILRRSNELIDFRCFLNKDTEQILKTLFTHFIQLYGKVAVRLFTICERIYQNIDMTSSSFIKNFQGTLDHERQKLVQSLVQLSRLFQDDKQKYLKLISLCIGSSIFKILTLQKQIEDIQFQTVFHTVYWEITGTHSTSQILKKLLEETFNGVNFHTYLINKEISRSYKNQSISKSMIKNSISFTDDKLCNVNQHLNYSVKDIDIRKSNLKPNYKGEMTFSKIIKRKENFNKENSASYINYSQADPVLDYTKSIQQNQIWQKKDLVCQFTETDLLKSNTKNLNFKKDRIAINQKFLKTNSRNKIFNDFESSSRKPSFANCLQQKQRKLKF